MLGTYQFGSKAIGTDFPWSDTDHGMIIFSGLNTINSLNPSRASKPKNKQNKNGFNDCEQMELVKFFEQCMNPSINFHPKLTTLQSDVLDVKLLRFIVNTYIDWRSYIYRGLSFANNCSKTPKGVLQRLYATRLLSVQLISGQFTIRPTFWDVTPHSSIRRVMEQTLSQTIDTDYWWDFCTDDLQRFGYYADELERNRCYKERQEILLHTLFDVIQKIR